MVSGAFLPPFAVQVAGPGDRASRHVDDVFMASSHQFPVGLPGSCIRMADEIHRLAVGIEPAHHLVRIRSIQGDLTAAVA